MCRAAVVTEQRALQLRELQAELQAAAALTQEALGWASGAPAATADAAHEASTQCRAAGLEAEAQDGSRGAAACRAACRKGASPQRAAQCTPDRGEVPRQHGAPLRSQALPGTRLDAAEAGARPCPKPCNTLARRGAAVRQQGPAAGNNARIHPRSRYADAEPDFAALAARFPRAAAVRYVRAWRPRQD